MAIEWILMDLGGVCLDVHQGAIYERMAGHFSSQVEELSSLKQAHKAIWVDIGVREVTTAECHAMFSTTFPQSLTEMSLIECINAELGPQIDHTYQVLGKLSGKVGLGCLSNTNSIHAAKLLSDYPVMNLFERRFFSQELGLSKPDHAIYERTEMLLQVPAGAILFFDDKEENIEAARQCGWNAYAYTGPQSLLRALDIHGLSFD